MGGVGRLRRLLLVPLTGKETEPLAAAAFSRTESALEDWNSVESLTSGRELEETSEELDCFCRH